MNNFCVITGLDGVGTSSVARKLHELDSGSFLYSSPPIPYLSCREKITSLVKDVSPVAHYYYYLSANIYLSRIIERAAKKDSGNIYCVRFLIDTVVSHRVAGLNVLLKYKTELFEILRPDFTFFLIANEKTRQQRISKRAGGKSKLDIILDDHVVRQRFLDEFYALKAEFIEIETSEKKIDNIANEIFHIINSKKIY